MIKWKIMTNLITFINYRLTEQEEREGERKAWQCGGVQDYGDGGDNKGVEEQGGENDDVVELTEQEEVEGGRQAWQCGGEAIVVAMHFHASARKWCGWW